MAMGKVTYWDPFVALAKLAARGAPELEMINSVTTAPYIRDFSITGNYRFSTDLELTATGFFGSDGVGAEYNNKIKQDGNTRDVDLVFDWMNFRAFLIPGITWSPRRDMLFRGSFGAGLYKTDMIADITIQQAPDPALPEMIWLPESDQDYMDYMTNMDFDGKMTDTTLTYQGRADFDWAPRERFIFAAGVQELYTQWIKNEKLRRYYAFDERLKWQGRPAVDQVDLSVNVENQGVSSSAYTLLEYQGLDQKFDAELGLRMDHFYFIGRDFTIQTVPVLNPRLNLDFDILKNRGSSDAPFSLNALTLTVGTGLFSSMNDTVSIIDISNTIADFELKPNRSWTSLAGVKIDFAEKLIFNFEVYYKLVFDRAYRVITTYDAGYGNVRTVPDYKFNGKGRIVGFDFILQKLESRYWDGWLSYSFTWARYRNPDQYSDPGNDWYYPYFHRYHNLNLVLNLKPSPSFHIGTRFGFASGTPDSDDNDERTGFSWPVDVKFSFFRFNPRGKVNTEIYLGIENLQALVYDAVWIARANGYTGEEDPSEYKPVYELPIPMVSFGFKWRY
jgi:hypothetical protein